MKTATLTGIRKLAIVDAPQPSIQQPTDLLLKIDAVGVCGSDIHYYVTGRIGSQVVEYPYPVGHECSATVVEAGPGCTRLRAGDRVAVDPAVSCGECDQCRKGRFHTCRKLVFMGCPGQIDGCLSEFYVMPERSCFKVKDTTSAADAALIEPLSIGVYAVELAQMDLREAKIGILGLGPIGLSVLLGLQAHDAQHIYATDLLEYRRDAAAANGAKWVGHPHDDVLGQVQTQEPELLDVVFECCGQQEALDQAVSLLAPGGKLMLIGIPEVDRVSFPIDQLRRRELCIQNVRRQNECVPAAIELLESGKVDASFMHTHDFSLDQCQAAFDLVDAYADGVIKAIVTP